MRGKECRNVENYVENGITPAYAGKRNSQSWNAGGTQDHPRVCGEKKCWKLWWINGAGSPPRMRGKVRRMRTLEVVGGITPAYAGKRLANLYWWRGNWDHPRVCGEKNAIELELIRRGGSPPRMRGKDHFRGCIVLAIGITPAYAGKSRSWRKSAFSSRDHPRVCGEKQSTQMRV